MTRPVIVSSGGPASLHLPLSLMRGVAAALLLLGGAATPATAQLISIRTVPVSQAHQFDIFPSHSLAMGSVSIALRDSLLDPFTNPAKGTRLGGPIFAGSPSLYGVSSQAGGGRTLPLGALSKTGPWYGGMWLGLQQVDRSRQGLLIPDVLPLCPACAIVGTGLPRDERTHSNRYLFAMAGRDLRTAGISVGGSVLWSDLNGVDGVDLLYPGSTRIQQHGGALDMRLGVLKEWDGERSLEVMALHNRFGMTHDIFHLDHFWDPANQRVMQQPRLEQNLDQNNTWGLHLAYERPLTPDGWKIGWLGTVNLTSHREVPNYEIMDIPRDPGHSAAFNFGVGIARTLPTTTFGLDLIYEPIWSHTWAGAQTPVETQLGETIAPGGKIIENDFRFSNALFRVGVAENLRVPGDGGVLGLQLGLVVRPIHYWLEQRDNVQLTTRSQRERWVEWTPTWGVSLHRPTLELRYRGSVTNGTSRPGVGPPGGSFQVGLADPIGSIIPIAPGGPGTLDPVRVRSHELSISLPLR